VNVCVHADADSTLQLLFYRNWRLAPVL
jgi:hypothetical protein